MQSYMYIQTLAVVVNGHLLSLLQESDIFFLKGSNDYYLFNYFNAMPFSYIIYSRYIVLYVNYLSK